MPLRTTYQDFYTASQAMKELGVTEGMFYNFIRNGDLQGTTLPGRKQKLYSKQAVEQLARELRAFAVTRKKISSQFARATKEDVADCARISGTIFDAAFAVEKQIAWMEKNPDICYVVKNIDNKVVGHVLMLPLEPEIIEKILREEIFSLNLETRDIGTFEPGKPLHLYMASIAVEPKLTLTEQHTYGARLIAGLMDVLINFGKQGIILATLTARSSTSDGIRLMRGIGFTEIPSTTRMKNFLIEVEKSGIKEIMQYKQALRESGVNVFSEDVPLLPRVKRDKRANPKESNPA